MEREESGEATSDGNVNPSLTGCGDRTPFILFLCLPLLAHKKISLFFFFQLWKEKAREEMIKETMQIRR